jgi:hypothetical protein
MEEFTSSRATSDEEGTRVYSADYGSCVKSRNHEDHQLCLDYMAEVPRDKYKTAGWYVHTTSYRTNFAQFDIYLGCRSQSNGKQRYHFAKKERLVLERRFLEPECSEREEEDKGKKRGHNKTTKIKKLSKNLGVLKTKSRRNYRWWFVAPSGARK